jgi:hypothetical protein
MKRRLRPRRRPGVAAYLEVFILIGLAAAGSVVVLAAGLRSLASVQGASVSVTGGTIRQGEYLAIETFLIQNTGNVPFNSFEVSTSGVFSNATYCYSIYDPTALSTMGTTCPTLSPNPAEVSVSAAVTPGRAVLVEITVMGEAFPPGSVCTVTVTTSAGSQGSIGIVAVPA